MKILIVDDDPIGRNVLRKVVEHYGHDVIEAGDGQEGLDKALQHKPDAIISDALMPKMDGFQFLRAVRQDETLSKIPFVFYTSIYTGDKEYELALSLGADALIVKPARPEELWKEFTSALDAHASKKKPAGQTQLSESEEDRLMDYCRMVAAKLEEKVRELEETIKLHRQTENDLRNVEKDLKAASDEWRKTFDAIGNAVALIDRDGKILRCNIALTELAGKDFPEIIGHKCWEVIRDTSVPVDYWTNEKALKRETFVMQQGNRWFEVTTAPFLDSEGTVLGAVCIMTDVTEQKLNQETLSQSEQRYRNLVESAQDVIFMLSSDGTFMSLNPVFERITGWSRAEIIGQSFTKFVHPDDLSIAKDHFLRVMRGESPPLHVLRILHRSGDYIYGEFLTKPTLQDGNIVGLFGIARDITERQWMEAALKEAIVRTEDEKARADSIIAAIGDGITIQDRDFRILYQNQSAKNLTGDHVGELCYMAYEKREHRCEGCGVAMVFEDGEVHTVVRSAPTDKGIIFLEITASPLRDSKGNIIAGIEVVHNITERKRLGDSLSESEAQFRALVEQSITGIALIQDGVFVYVNPRMTEMLGYQPAEMLGVSPPDMVAEADREMVRENIRKRLSGEVESMHYTFRALHKDGREIEAELHSTVIMYRGKRAALSTLLDITERKKAEMLLQEQKTFTENLIQNSAVATFVLSSQHTVLTWNRACEELTGYPAFKMIGTTGQWKPFYDHERPVLADIVMSDDPESLLPLYSTYSKSLLMSNGLHAEGWFQNMNGRDRYIVFDAAPIYNASGEVIAAIETLQDITERKLAEETIRESEERYRNLFDNAHEMIQSVGPDGHFIYVNPEWRKVLGYNQEDLQTLTIFDIIHESCKQHCMTLFGKAMSGEPIEFLEATFVAKDGRLVEIEGNASVRMVDGKVVATQGILRDVTERKKLEEQLSQITREWEETFNSITDMVTVHDKDFNIIRANKAAEKILGLPFLEGKKVKCFEHYHGAGCPPDGCPSCQSLVTGKPSTAEMFEPHLKMYIEIQAIPRLDGNNEVVGLIHVVRDISERKKAEERSRQHSREIMSLAEASNVVLTTTTTTSVADTATSMNFYNYICDIAKREFDLKFVWIGLLEKGSFEIKPAGCAGCEEGYLSAIKITYDDSPYGVGPTGTAVKTRRAQTTNDIKTDPLYEVWRQQALERGLHSSMAAPLINSEGNVIGVFNIYSDKKDFFSKERVELFQVFSNQLSTAIENRLLIEDLERKVVERTKELEDANRELQLVNTELILRREEADVASRSKTDFLANMSHELRTPLNAIMGFSDIMQQGMAGPVTDKQKEFLNDISESGNHLLTLITDILDLSKIEAGKLELEPGTVSLKEIIESSLSMFKEKALKHAIKVTTEIDDAITSIIADQRKLKQVIVNLLSNAFKFTPDGGSVQITARKIGRSEGVESLSETSALPIFRADGDFIEISVSDTGIGISKEHQQRLFQPFQQIETSLTRKYAGTGLGLSLCRRLIELHGGRIWVESEPGKGSRFVFIIPVKQ